MATVALVLNGLLLLLAKLLGPDQIYSLYPAVALRSRVRPSQTLGAKIVMAGKSFTLMVTLLELLHPKASVTVTEYVPL